MSTIPPGWYPNQASPGTERWWDGNAWTIQVRGAQQTWPAPIAAPEPARKPRRIGTVERAVIIASAALVVVIAGALVLSGSAAAHHVASITPVRAILDTPVDMTQSSQALAVLQKSGSEFASEKKAVAKRFGVPADCESLWMQAPLSSADARTSDKLHHLGNFTNPYMSVTAVARVFPSLILAERHQMQLQQDIQVCGRQYNTKLGGVGSITVGTVALNQVVDSTQWIQSFESGPNKGQVVDVADISYHSTVVRATCNEKTEDDLSIQECETWFREVGNYVALAQ